MASLSSQNPSSPFLPHRIGALQGLLRHLPHTPGVYQMKDSKGTVIYVGKARNLSARVGSYFHERTLLTLAKKQMIARIADIEIILCQTEVEALVLETNLIKHLNPKYNILMKDDKNLSYIKIMPGVIAEVIKTRKKITDGGEYFGPYTFGANITGSLHLLKRIFHIRACRMKFAIESLGGKEKIRIRDKAGRSVPCMDYYIGICPAPCLLSEEAIRLHQKNVRALRMFLSGKESTLVQTLREKMLAEAKATHFERAGKIKEQIEAIEKLCERQIVRDAISGEHDICVLFEKYQKYFVALTQIRGSKVVGVFHFTLDFQEESYDTILTQFLARYYSDASVYAPKTLLLEKKPKDQALLDFFVKKSIKIAIPRRGKKWEAIGFTKNQAREYAYKSTLQTLERTTLTRTSMEEVLQKLGYLLPKKGARIFECYDISHTHGHFSYASRVVVKNGKAEPSLYKKYKVTGLLEGDIDDFASHREIMFRRMSEALHQEDFESGAASYTQEHTFSENALRVDTKKKTTMNRKPYILKGLPDLLIIDGGKGQLSAAKTGINEAIMGFAKEHPEIPQALLRAIYIPLCSLAKREEEIFIPEKKEAILFQKGSSALMVLQKARDESHRFSLGANRQARTKAMKKNIFEEIPGIGPMTRKKLLTLTHDVAALKEYPLADLQKILNKKQIEALRDHGIL